MRWKSDQAYLRPCSRAILAPQTYCGKWCVRGYTLKAGRAAHGGRELPIVARAAIYEEAARSLFGPLSINCSAPDDGNMNLLSRTGTPAQQEWWLRPVVEGKVKSAFAMTEPAPGGGSDPGMIRTRAEKKNGKWIITGRKWFITGAAEAAHFIVIARTSD